MREAAAAAAESARKRSERDGKRKLGDGKKNVTVAWQPWEELVPAKFNIDTAPILGSSIV